MSMICNTLLNEIVNEKGITNPSDILDQLNKGIRQALHQNLPAVTPQAGSVQTGLPAEASAQAGRGEYTANDGMDLSLVAIQPANAGGVRSLQFAGAQRPLYLITNGQLKKIQGNIDTIGGTRKRFVKNFTNHELKLKKGDTFYLFSDGYTDQFGGPDDERFMTARFQQLLLKINHLPMKKQHNILEKTFEEWKGNGKQIDDILVMGVRV